MNDRLRWMRNSLKTQELQGMIVLNPINVHYLTSIDAEGILLITAGENYYITDDRYIEKVQRELMIDDEIVLQNIKEIMPEDYESYFADCENVGFEENYVTYAKYKEILRKYKMKSLVETDGIIEKQRQIKDEEEIYCIKKACEITDACFSHIVEYIKKGMTEKQIANEIERFFKENDTVLAFDTIVASGENSSMPHCAPTDREIMSGDVITIDMGCKYKGYASDMTRTIFACNVPEEIKEIFNLVFDNEKIALNEVRDGANIKVISKIVEGNFRINGYDVMHALRTWSRIRCA